MSSNKCNNVNKCVDGLSYSSKVEYPPQLETGKRVLRQSLSI
jgi:hypothetical protein